MLSRDQVLDTIDHLYAMRVAADLPAIERLWAPEATFRISIDPSLLQDMTFEGDPMIAVNRLVEHFRFHAVRRIETLVEGNKAAVLCGVDLSVAGKPPLTTRIFDLFELDDERRVRSLIQFVDTAMMLKLME